MHIVRVPEVLFREIDGEAVLLGAHDPEVYAMNRVGTRVWRLLETDRTFEDLVAAVRAEFGVDDETARRDLQSFVDDMRQRGFVSVHDEPAR